MLQPGYRWYGKYVAETAADGQYPLASPRTDYPAFQVYNSGISGRILVVDTAVAPVFIAAITLVTSFAVPLLFVRVARAVAVWRYGRAILPSSSSPPAGAAQGGAPQVYGGYGVVASDETGAVALSSPVSVGGGEQLVVVPLSHVPVLLTNCGKWLSDAWCALCLFWRGTFGKKGDGHEPLAYALLFAFSVVAFAAGPLVAFLISREVVSGFSGAVNGPCIPQNNFTNGAVNPNTNGSDHHGRAMELLPFIGSFKYTWSATGGDAYLAGGPVVDPVSQVKYERVDGCLLTDDVYCDARFPHTHKVSGELTAAQMGLWFGRADWRFRTEGYCIKLNSSAIAARLVDGSYQYHLGYAAGARRLRDATQEELRADPPLGQFEFQRFERHKNVITDSYFVNTEEDIGWAHYPFRQSLRDLDVEALAVLTVLPSTTEKINQSPDDELFLSHAPAGSYRGEPSNIAHILCWERLFLVVDGQGETNSSQKWSPWRFRDAAVRERFNLPRGVEPLAQFAFTEFIIKPLRFLRGSVLLQSLADTPRWEIDPTFAAAVPFGAEVHRWAHVGLLDISSKATRTASGYYARGITQPPALLERIAADAPALADLCGAVRTAREGTVSLPLAVTVSLFVLLLVAGLWWAVEAALTSLAASGRSLFGLARPFLVLPATTPPALSAAAVAANDAAGGYPRGWTLRFSASGWPEVGVLGMGPPTQSGRPGPVLAMQPEAGLGVGVGVYKLVWGIRRWNAPPPSSKARIKLG
jgi:hypothetical protein